MKNTTKVEYSTDLKPMSEDMESIVIKQLKLDRKDECVLIKDDVLALFNEYEEKMGYLPS